MKKINFNLGENITAFTTLKDNTVDKNSIAADLGIEPSALFVPEQTHSSHVEIIDSLSQSEGDDMQGLDALVTQEPGKALAARTADCLPVFFFDPKVRVIAVAHGGWRGLVAGILENTVANMINLGAKPPRIKVQFGPHIAVESYEVGDDILSNFCPDEVTERDGRRFVDLSKVALNRLAQVGVLPENISLCDIDTFTNPDCFSARKEGIDTGRMYSVIMLD